MRRATLSATGLLGSPKLARPAILGRKGERTKAALKAATAKVLAARGFHETRVNDICSAAGVSQGNFYIYFGDKVEAVKEVLADFIREHFSQVLSGPHHEDAFAAILTANQRYIEIFEKHSRLSRSLGEALYAIPELRRQWEQGTAEFSRRIAEAVARRCPRSQSHERARLFAAHGLQAMVDSIVLGYFAWEDPLLRRTVRSPEELAEYLSVLWHRAMYGRDPRASQVKHARSMLALKLPTQR